MGYKVGVSPTFQKKAKRLVKKYASLKAELLDLIDLLEEDPEQGKPIGSVASRSGWRYGRKEAASLEARA